MDLSALLASVGASVLTVVGGLLVARRFQKLGGGEAQDRLNKIRADLDAAMTEKLRVMGDDFITCKARLGEVEQLNVSLRRDIRELRTEISDLHADMRKMRVDRQGAKDRASD